MKLQPTKIAGMYVIEPEMIRDMRGSFARVWSRAVAAGHGMKTQFLESSFSITQRKGTIRGMHYQAGSAAEAKLVQVTRGRIYDVAVDLRRDSATHKAWFGVELSRENRKLVYVPEGCAHGLLTLEDETEVRYDISAKYDPSAARGVRWDDAAFGIEWPMPEGVAEPILSEKDAGQPDYLG